MLKSTQNEFLILKKTNQTQFLNQIKCLFQISDLMYTSVFLFKKNPWNYHIWCLLQTMFIQVKENDIVHILCN